MARSKLFLSSSALLISTLVASACSNVADDCDNTSTCGSGGTSSKGGTSAGTSGKSGTSGSTAGGNGNGAGSNGESGSSGSSAGGTDAGASGGGSGGGTAGTGGGAEGGGGSGGEGGVPVPLPCDGACTAPKPVCDEPADTCVECLQEADCSASTKKKCDTAKKACVECLASTDCPNATAAKCDNGACVKCTTNADCAHVAGKTVCDTAAGECVQCTGTDYAACGMDAGTPLVCDSKARTCTTKKKASAGLCQACVTDAQCKAGQLCVKETFGAPAMDVGYFCFSKQSTVPSADCTLTTNQPYVKPLINQTSIDGQGTDVCGLAVSTCVSVDQFRSKDCSTTQAADDLKCGFAPTKDSKCAAYGATQFRCTMTCLSDDDCPTGSACDKSGTPWVCAL